MGAAIIGSFDTCKHGLDTKFFGSDLAFVGLVIDYYWFDSGSSVGSLNLLENVQSSLNKGHYKLIKLHSFNLLAGAFRLNLLLYWCERVEYRLG